MSLSPDVQSTIFRRLLLNVPELGDAKMASMVEELMRISEWFVSARSCSGKR